MLFSISLRFAWRGGTNLKMWNRKWLFPVSECTLSTSDLDLPFWLSQSSHLTFYPISRAITNLIRTPVFLLLTSIHLSYFRKILINYYSWGFFNPITNLLLKTFRWGTLLKQVYLLNWQLDGSRNTLGHPCCPIQVWESRPYGHSFSKATCSASYYLYFVLLFYPLPSTEFPK